MNLQKLLSYTRQAVDAYNMIEEGDNIAIGMSGGKDSLTLLYALNGLRRFYPKKFNLQVITIDLGFHNLNLNKIKELCQELDIPYTIVKTKIADIVFDIKKEKNPCALCAKMRKGAMTNIMKELGCNKIAYGHQKDDIIESFMMSLLYEGRIHTFSPTTHFEDNDISVIRPLLYVSEAEVRSFAKKENLPILKSPCPADGNTKRSEVRATLLSLEKQHRGTKNRIFTALQSTIDK